ncbi:MAG: ribose-5-phosphate isomerase RpiA [Candidatus Methanomethyliaceae archaeon]|nr:ribose-5-phosphate isomerase RpiA [Candidatus Methanomethyliaceae archaeon]
MTSATGKRKAAEAALAEVKNGQILGLGTGSTVAIFIELLGNKVKKEGWKIIGVPTSYQSAYLAIKNGIQLTTLDEHPILDLSVDGADELDKRLNLIKGGGAALTREKIVDSSAKRFVVIADGSKLVERLGAKTPVPIEVLPMARATVANRIRLLGGEPKLRDGGDRKDGPLITDNGNFIIDADFGAIEDPQALEFVLKRIPGIVEAGLFINLARTAYLGSDKGVRRLDRKY